MKKTFSGFLTALTVIVIATFAHAEGTPIQLTHALTAYEKEATEVKLEYAVEVLNQGDAALNSLTLTLVTRPPFVTTKKHVVVKSLDPKQKTEVRLKFLSRLLLNEDQLAQKPLLWSVKYIDANGKLVEFPVKSRPGGAP